MNDLNSRPPGLATGWRIALWGSLAALLFLPALAMQFTDEVQWTRADLVVGFMLLALLGFGIEAAARAPARLRVFFMLGAVALFLLIWAELAVGLFD